MASTPDTARQSARQVTTDHEGFLRHRGWRWLKISALVCLVAVIGYVAADVQPRRNGGSWMGYTLGTVGAGLIFWLSLLGIRKRSMTPGAWSLKAWTSAHVYLGLALVVIGTLHTGFQFGWNVHTLAYALMIVVIASGIFGISAYATLPASLSANRGEMTQAQMLEGLHAIDRQLVDAAQPLARHWSDQVIAAMAEDPFSGGLWRRLSGRNPRSPTRAAMDAFDRADAAESADPVLRRVEGLLQRRAAQLERTRRHLRIKALLEVWLFVHVPATFALLAALSAHIVSVFYYW
ncbi:MAG TPA: hypothetical protein PKE25_00660 [Novosphingobium sp.]|nr:hypothetical protein [Novosphingobium sp.]